MRVLTLVGLVALVRVGDALRIGRAADDGNVGARETVMPSVEWTAASTAPTPPANFSGLDKLLDVYNAERVASNWVAERVNVSRQCFRDMDTMFRASERGDIWAIKSKCDSS